MHMANHLVSPEVGSTMFLLSSIGIVYAAKKIRQEPELYTPKKVAMLAATSALVFAGQMINYSIPLTGSSGHIVGAILLALLFGNAPATLAMSLILTIQSLVFADGGLFALGANIFNMAILPCLIIMPLFNRLIKKQNVGSLFFETMLSVQIGAFAVVIETYLSGITALPFRSFVALMQPIHLAIGAVEGIVTIVLFALISKFSTQQFLPYLIAISAIFVSSFCSIFASQLPDGLEWSMEELLQGQTLGFHQNIMASLEKMQQSFALLPDYRFSNLNANLFLGNVVSGILGTTITFVLILVIFRLFQKLSAKRLLSA